MKHPKVHVCAELGVNHDGRRDILLRLARAAHDAGVDSIKIQVKDPATHATPGKFRESCTAPEGELISELEHRTRMELSDDDLRALDTECKRLGLPWFASAWDRPSIERVRPWKPAFWKLASASSTDLDLVRATRKAADETGATVIASTGATSEEECDRLMAALGTERTILCACLAQYPADNAMLNTLTMLTLGQRYGVPVGWSGHEKGIQVSSSLVAMGAAARFLMPGLPWGPAVIERHLTLDRSMRGSDHAASLEPQGMRQLVRDIRVIEESLGDGVKRVSEVEAKAMARLRRVV